MQLQEKFDRLLEDLGTPSCLIAVSGGVDSMTLATLFANSSLRPKFEVAHVNFSLRGDESDGDQALVEKWCQAHGQMLHLKRFDTSKYAQQRGISIEMAARELRYGWFDQLLEERGLDLLAVAHNRNDNIETLFLNLLRGTGLRGACGMQRVSGRIFRPLLEVSRAGIEAFAIEAGIEWRTDSSNLQSEFARNRIRNEIFPQLERINTSFLNSIGSSMQHFAQAQAVLEELFEQKKSALSRNEGDTFLIDIAALSAERHSGWWLFRLLDEYGFNSAQISEIEQSLQDGKVGKIFHSGNYTLVKDRDSLKIRKSGFEVAPPQVTIIERSSEFDPKALPAGTLCVDAEKISLPLSAREWQDGERFRPFGMKGSRLISDFLTDLKMDRELKRRQTVIADSCGNIICIKGLRIDDKYRITEKTQKVAIIS